LDGILEDVPHVIYTKLGGQHQGEPSAAIHERVLDAWFPGGGTQKLPLAYAHTLDRY
jgi:hypothetical protein